MMSEELKPCPFCGGEAHMPYYGDRVECRDCKGSVMTIAAWNTRVADHPPTTNPVVDHETGNMIDKLRPAAEVLRDASNALLPPIRGEWESILRMQEKAAAVIEADRQATRAALVREIVAWLRGNCMSGKWRILASEIEAKWGK